MKEQIEQLIQQSINTGEKNLAIILLCYQGAEKIGMEHQMAAHCQGFAKEMIKFIRDEQSALNN